MDVVKTEKVVVTLDNADALEHFLNNDLNSRYEYKGWVASRRPKVLETMADGGGFIVVVEQLTTEYIESRVETYFKAASIVSEYYDKEYKIEHDAQKAREDERLRQAKEQWNSRSLWRKFKDAVGGNTFYFYCKTYRVPYRVDYRLDIMQWIRAELLMEKPPEVPGPRRPADDPGVRA